MKYYFIIKPYHCDINDVICCTLRISPSRQFLTTRFGSQGCASHRRHITTYGMTIQLLDCSLGLQLVIQIRVQYGKATPDLRF